MLFVKLNAGCSLDEALKRKINTTLRTKASPRHVPALILAVADIPCTFNGKKIESAVTNIINHRAVTNRDALGNPESLGIYESLLAYLDSSPEFPSPGRIADARRRSFFRARNPFVGCEIAASCAPRQPNRDGQHSQVLPVFCNSGGAGSLISFFVETASISD